LLELIKSLKENPEQGVSLGKGCFKIRIAIQSKGRGKSGGARIIAKLVVTKEIVYLLTIYDKSEKENLTNTELMEFLTYLSLK
jgi:hypothetical protein